MFFGKNNEVEEEWLESLETYMMAAGCQKEKKVLLAITSLREHAAEWFSTQRRAHPKLQQESNVFKNSITTFFDPQDRSNLARD